MVTVRCEFSAPETTEHIKSSDILCFRLCDSNMQKRKSKDLNFSCMWGILDTVSGNIWGIVVLKVAAAGVGYVAVPDQTGN